MVYVHFSTNPWTRQILLPMDYNNKKFYAKCKLCYQSIKQSARLGSQATLESQEGCVEETGGKIALEQKHEQHPN